MDPLSMNVDQLRELLTCPLSYELFKDPVQELGSCGHCFEKEWIEQWVGEKKNCPISRNFLDLNQLVPNVALRDACALLDPERVNPLTEDELNEVRKVAKAFDERNLSDRVSPEDHQSIMKTVITIGIITPFVFLKTAKVCINSSIEFFKKSNI